MKKNESRTGEMNLKKLLYETVCRPLCRFYKEGEAWEILRKRVIGGSLTIAELRDFAESIKDEVDMTGETKPPFDTLDQSLVDKVCKPLCEFYAEGQEYWEKDYQCGAYKLIKALITSEKLILEDLKIEEIDS
jgi:hypothetical protein